jgi:RNase P subunit RPR2
MKPAAFKKVWRDLYCRKCQTVQGFTLASVKGYKHYFCNQCNLFTVMDFTGDTYARSDKMQRIEETLPYETEQN